MKTKMLYQPIIPIDITRHARVISTGIFVPENIVRNDDIINRFDLIATDRAVQYSLGIKERRWDNQGLRVEDFLANAASQCLEQAGIGIEKVDRIIFTRLMGDYQVPSTSIGLLRKLNCSVGIPAFDIASACSGFIHAIDMAIRYIDSGDDYVLILGGGIPSWAANYSGRDVDTTTIFLYGDGMAAILLGYSETQHIYCSYIDTDNSKYEVAYVPLGTELLNKTKAFKNEIFGMKITDGRAIYDCAVESAQNTVAKLLESAGMTMDQIDIVVTSDQTTHVWEGQLKALNIPLEKSLSQFHQYGNTIAAMVLFNLHGLISSGKLKRGMNVLMMSHGAGASGGGIIFRY